MTLAEIEALSHKHPIIFYDGVCILCDNFIQFVHKNDKSDVFRFATLQDEAGQLIKTKLNIDSNEKDETVILMYDGKMSIYSDVSLKVFQLLGWPYKVLAIFSIIPKKIRDAIYFLIARNRYKWFGKTEECMIPAGRLKEKLLT